MSRSGELPGSPRPSTPEQPTPVVHPHVAPRGAATLEPVNKPITILRGGRVPGTGLREYTFELPGAMLEPTEPAVQVEGYRCRSTILRHYLSNVRRGDLCVKLTPLTGTPPPPAQL